jgi:hypothetical protein
MKGFCSLLSSTSSAATFKKNQFFKGYVNQICLNYRHYFMDSNFNLFYSIISVIYIQFFYN